ncbi:unnamed protein product [Lathyrus sativus]|nr:unnamed protein product [Lathyrus sativus]
MECNKDTATLNTVVERDRIFDFLAGLNAEFDPIRVQILGKEKFPDLNEVFYTVHSGSPSTFYYSFNAGGVHFIMLGAYINYDKTGEQYRWLERDLANVDR